MDIADRPSAAEFLSPGVVHYENGPATTRMVERGGRLWAVTYIAERDKTGGWRVVDVRVEPEERPGEELRPGDLVDVRCKIEQDMGTDIQLRVEGDGYSQRFWAKRSAIVRIHRPAA